MRVGAFNLEQGEGTLTLRRRVEDDNLLVATCVFIAFIVVMSVTAQFVPALALLIPLVFFAVFGLVLSLNWGNRLAGSVLRSVNRSLEVRFATGKGYRDASGRTLTIDGQNIDATRVRAVTTRHVSGAKGSFATHVWLVLDDCAFLVDSSQHTGVMIKLAVALREALETEGDPNDGKEDRASTGDGFAWLVVLELPAMFPAALPIMNSLDGGGSSILWLGPVEIAVVTLLFALLFRYLTSRDAPMRAKALFGIGAPKQ